MGPLLLFVLSLFSKLVIPLSRHFSSISKLWWFKFWVNQACDPGVISTSELYSRGSVWASRAALLTLLVWRGRIRSHPSPANSHQSGPMLEPRREEAIAHSTGAHFPSTQGGQGHLTHQGPVYFSLLSGATLCTSAAACACTLISALLHFFLVAWWLLCTSPACKCLNQTT